MSRFRIESYYCSSILEPAVWNSFFNIPWILVLSSSELYIFAKSAGESSSTFFAVLISIDAADDNTLSVLRLLWITAMCSAVFPPTSVVYVILKVPFLRKPWSFSAAWVVFVAARSNMLLKMNGYLSFLSSCSGLRFLEFFSFLRMLPSASENRRMLTILSFWLSTA